MVEEEVVEVEVEETAPELVDDRQDLAREAAHNLARIYCASGSKDLARQLLRSMPV